MMGSGENINKVIRTGSMDDVGTRLQFLTELYELWTEGIEIMDRWETKRSDYHIRREELVHARNMLYHHMTKDQGQNTDANAIDLIPRNPEDIKDENKT